MTLKKSNLGIHDASKHLNREINSQLDQIIFDLGIHSVDKRMIRVLLDHMHLTKTESCSLTEKTNDDHHNHELSVMIPGSSSALSYFSVLNQIVFITTKCSAMQLRFHMCF